MQVLQGTSAVVSFPFPITVSELPYAGPLTWLIDDGVGSVVVDPVTGASNSAVSAQIDPANPQQLLLTQVAPGNPFSVTAVYPGAVDACSIASQVRQLMWAVPQAFVPGMCVQVTG